MKPLVFFVLLTVLSHVGFVGSRITVSLSAISQGASPLTIGVLMALYAVIPMLLAVQAGRLVDRVGAFWPIAISGAFVAVGIVLPFGFPGMGALFASSTLARDYRRAYLDLAEALLDPAGDASQETLGRARRWPGTAPPRSLLRPRQRARAALPIQRGVPGALLP